MIHPFFEKQPTATYIRKRVEGYGSWFEVDLDAVGSNLAEVRRHTRAEIMPCIKNNAYGHGLLPLAAFFAEQGVDIVMVAKTREAIKVRDQVHMEVLNLDPLFTREKVNIAVKKGVTQLVYTREAAEQLSRSAVSIGKPAKVFVKVDTGLNRVGVRWTEAADFVEYVSKLPGISVECVMSALMQTPEQDGASLERLLAVDKELRQRGVDPGMRSLASTDAVFHNPSAHLDLIRPGMCLYGVYPEPKDEASGFKLKQALAFKARVEYVKTVEKGESVTYWGRFTAPERMKIGTLHVGFYDAIPREMANKARIRVGDGYRSSVGSVSLNHLLVDFRGVDAKAGDVVEVIGREGENSLAAFSRAAGWMVYSVMNHLNPFTPRIYTRGGEPVAIQDPA